jgi:isoamylase
MKQKDVFTSKLRGLGINLGFFGLIFLMGFTVACTSPVTGGGGNKGNDNAMLSDLSVSQGTLNPDFDPEITEYNLNLAQDQGTLTLSAAAEDSGAQVTGTGDHSLEHGDNLLALRVDASNNTTSRTYSITVNRAAPLGTPTLSPPSGPVLSGTAISIYSAPGATIRYTQGDGSQPAPTLSTGTVYDEESKPQITVGNTSLKLISFLGSDGITRWSEPNSANYSITTVNLNLGSLTVDAGNVALNPSFSPTTLDYSANVSHETSSVVLAAEAEDSGAAISGLGTKALAVGENPFTITVNNSSESKNYTLTITRAESGLSDNADLASLSLSAGTLTPSFNSSVLEYSASVSSGVNSITISAAAEEGTVSGTGVKALSSGSNPFMLTVTAPAGNTQTYQLTVQRASAVPPDAPSQVTASGVPGGAQITWYDNSDNEDGFEIYRRSEGEMSWEYSGSTPANTVTYKDTDFDAAALERYEYQVQAVNGAGDSSPIAAEAPVNLVGFIHPVSGTFSRVNPENWGSAGWPLGSGFSGNDLEIAVFSKNATRIVLEIYSVKHVWESTSVYPGHPTNDGHALYDYEMVKGPDDIWRAKLSNLRQFANSGLIYAFRVWGPNWPWDEEWSRGNSQAGFITDVIADQGHRFNPNKVLTDPYSYELSHDTEYPALMSGGENGGMYGTGGADSRTWADEPANSVYSGLISTGGAILDRRAVDTGRFVSKSYAIDIPAYSGVRPNVQESQTIVYEAHVKGISKHPTSGHMSTVLSSVKNVAGFEDFANAQDVPAQYRGTYKGAGMMAEYFAALGITAIEFVPIHETRNDLNETFTGGDDNPGNYWGYMTYSFFAPDRHYAYDRSPGGPTKEFQDMVADFAEHGIEVWLDVVYNHTGEGGNWGSPDITGFTSYGGFDAVEYYHLNPFDKRGMVDGATGVGNQTNFSRDVNHNLALDSLTYWIDHMGVAGFRFDLAAVMGREPDWHSGKPATSYWNEVKEFYSNHRTLTAIADLGQNRNAKMVAEAWDMWGYPVGAFPWGWLEWNGRYRDATRKFMRGITSGHAGVSVNDAFHGDYTFFNDNGGPHKSINFIVAHDGFTLADLVSYNAKTNVDRDWPFGPSDGGSDSNESWDSMIADGAFGVPNTQAFRRQRLRNLWVWHFFSRGTPMIVWGDEFARTQNGNNNPYNIDSVATWNNYEFIGRDSPQTAPPQGTWESLNTSTWVETVYHDNLGTDTKIDGMNNLFLFARSMIHLRKNEPAFHNYDYNVGFEYTKNDGSTLDSWDRARRIHIKGSSVSGGSDYVLLVNMWADTVDYTLPAAPAGTSWKRIIDTAHWAESAADTPVGNYWTDDTAWTWDGGAYGASAWSIVVFKALP